MNKLCLNCKNNLNSVCIKTEISKGIFQPIFMFETLIACGKREVIENLCSLCKHKIDKICAAKFAWNNIIYVETPTETKKECEKFERK